MGGRMAALWGRRAEEREKNSPSEWTLVFRGVRRTSARKRKAEGEKRGGTRCSAPNKKGGRRKEGGCAIGARGIR